MTVPDKNLKRSLEKLLTNPMSMREILRKLDVDKAERPRMRRSIKALAESGAIVRIKGNRYGLTEKMNLVTGITQGHRDGYGFLIPDDPKSDDLFLGANNFDEAMHGDRVVCRVESTRADGRREGKVIRILERAHEVVVGRFEKSKGGGYVAPFESRMSQNFFIPFGDTLKAKDGEAVIAEIAEYPSKAHQPLGRITKVLGDPGDPKVEIHIATARFHLRSEFPLSVISKARALKSPRDKDFKKGRLDLRDRPIVTIDGETAKDFDDAVEVEKLAGGEWRLGVHIADVSHYVTEGSPLDKEAYKRGVSVYLPGTVIPMLPFELSNVICSLNPKVDRLTMSCIMTINKNGDVIDYKIRESIIRSVERMTYGDVAAIVDKEDSALIARYGGLVENFRNMKTLAKLLQAKRRKNGAIDFDLPEPEVILDITGRPENIIRAERNVAHRIIEEFMLLANRTVAEHIVNRGYPAIHRVHDKPDPLKIEAFKEFVSAFGFRFGENDQVSSRNMQEVLASVSGKPEEKLITHVLLRSMKQARYSSESLGHFALGFSHYAHFTSPIRRYPDLIVHRALKEIIQKKKKPGAWSEKTEEIAEHCSSAGRTAEDAERDMVKLKQTQYMATRVGEKFDGIISGVTNFGFFVELNEPAVDGLVRVTTIHDDYYNYKESEHALVGERTGKRFRLGDPARIMVANVSTERRQIDFEWIGVNGGGKRKRSLSLKRTPGKRSKKKLAKKSRGFGGKNKKR